MLAQCVSTPNIEKMNRNKNVQHHSALSEQRTAIDTVIKEHKCITYSRGSYTIPLTYPVAMTLILQVILMQSKSAIKGRWALFNFDVTDTGDLDSTVLSEREVCRWLFFAPHNS